MSPLSMYFSCPTFPKHYHVPIIHVLQLSKFPQALLRPHYPCTSAVQHSPSPTTSPLSMHLSCPTFPQALLRPQYPCTYVVQHSPSPTTSPLSKYLSCQTFPKHYHVPNIHVLKLPNIPQGLLRPHYPCTSAVQHSPSPTTSPLSMYFGCPTFPKPYYVPIIHVLQLSNISPSPTTSPLSMHFSCPTFPQALLLRSHYPCTSL
jgi:hypothetical protein